MSTATVEAREFEEIVAALSEPLPDSLVKQRIGWRDSSGEERWVDYIEWYTAADILDRVCPDWSHEVRDIKVIGDLVAVTAAITIKGVTRCGIGVDSALDERGIKGAEHDALKRAAVKFGLARYLYSRGTKSRKAPIGNEIKPAGAKDAGSVTEKQLSAIYAIAKAKSLDARLESKSLFRCEPEQLSRNAASELIDHLRNVRISA
ncbi:MAG TPA: Rad52/Rad22 family DNA repair protein [Blastocatellia bacterium]|nr:Rad52/Rad22 family DNA repair protein [Blastocatellia bacterium]